MGLDMFAVRRVDTFWEAGDPPKKAISVQLADVSGRPVNGIETDRIQSIDEDVMYWRKANHVHKWFVDTVMDGNDGNDGRWYHVSWENLERLRSVCNEVIEASKLVPGMAHAGEKWEQGMKQPVTLREAGKVIEDPFLAKQVLPTCSGFFFGHTEYDERYLDNVIKTRDWASQMIGDHRAGVPGQIYYSSWW